MYEYIRAWFDSYQGDWQQYRWPIVIVALAFWSYITVLGRSFLYQIRLRLRLLGPHFRGLIASGKVLGIPTTHASELLMILNTSMSSKDGKLHATGHGQYRGAVEFSNYIHLAYGKLRPLDIKLSKDLGIDDALEKSSLIIIGGPRNNEYLRLYFSQVLTKLEKLAGDRIVLEDNKITLNRSNGETKICVPKYFENTRLDKVYGIVARADTGTKGRRLILAAGTKTQGTLAACQFFTRNISLWRSLLNPSFVAIVCASTSGSGLKDEIEEVYFRRISDDRS